MPAANYIADIEAQLTAAGIPLLDKSRYTATDGTASRRPTRTPTLTRRSKLLTDLNTTIQAGETDKIAAAYRLLDINLAPVGSGAYKVGTYTPGQSVELLRNDGYYLFTPGPAKVLIPIIKDATAEADALSSGNVDWITEITSADSLAKLKADTNVKLSEYSDLGYYFMAFNVRKGHVFSDVVARQALGMCIDQATTVQVATEGNGIGVKAEVPPGSFYYNPDVPDYKHDVAGAKALLESNGLQAQRDGVYAKDGKHARGDAVRPPGPSAARQVRRARPRPGQGVRHQAQRQRGRLPAVLLPLLDYPNNFDIYLGGWGNLLDPEDSQHLRL